MRLLRTGGACGVCRPHTHLGWGESGWADGVRHPTSREVPADTLAASHCSHGRPRGPAAAGPAPPRPSIVSAQRPHGDLDARRPFGGRGGGGQPRLGARAGTWPRRVSQLCR